MEGNNSSDEETLSEDNTDVSEDSDDVELDVMDDEDDEDDDDDENTRPPEGVVDIDWRKRNEYEGLQKPASSKIYRHTGDVGKRKGSLNITTSYIPNWNMKDGYRELLSNLLDSVEERHPRRRIVKIISKNKSMVQWFFLSRDGKTLLGLVSDMQRSSYREVRFVNWTGSISSEAFLLGSTTKRVASKSRGLHGEGLKAAIVVILREQQKQGREACVKVYSNHARWKFSLLGLRQEVALSCTLMQQPNSARSKKAMALWNHPQQVEVVFRLSENSPPLDVGSFFVGSAEVERKYPNTVSRGVMERSLIHLITGCSSLHSPRYHPTDPHEWQSTREEHVRSRARGPQVWLRYNQEAYFTTRQVELSLVDALIRNCKGVVYF